MRVRNRFVVDRLVDNLNAPPPAPQRYAIVHADTSDARGIDVAFFYDEICSFRRARGLTCVASADGPHAGH